MNNSTTRLIMADDFAMSKGVNIAILELSAKKLLNGFSTLVTGGFYDEYLRDLQEQKKNDIKIGLHLDLTFGKARYQRRNSLLVDNEGVFKNSFLKILLLSFFKRRVLIPILYREINQQMKQLSSDIGSIDYLDGHQHIHTIPLAFKITQRLAKKYHIPRLRIINEYFFTSFDYKNPPSIVAIIKFLVLKLCYLANQTKSNIYFYSILYSCKINPKSVDRMRKLPTKYLEIMLHPGYSDIDSTDIHNREYKHLTSKYRDIERMERLVGNLAYI